MGTRTRKGISIFRREMATVPVWFSPRWTLYWEGKGKRVVFYESGRIKECRTHEKSLRSSFTQTDGDPRVERLGWVFPSTLRDFVHYR